MTSTHRLLLRFIPSTRTMLAQTLLELDPQMSKTKSRAIDCYRLRIMSYVWNFYLMVWLDIDNDISTSNLVVSSEGVYCCGCLASVQKSEIQFTQ